MVSGGFAELWAATVNSHMVIRAVKDPGTVEAFERKSAELMSHGSGPC